MEHSESPDNTFPIRSGAEPCIVGLSPGYWANLPVSIADVHQMKIVGGVNCMIRQESKNNKTTLQCYPVSRCVLGGMIVLVHAKANNSYFYVIDDGTGWIDCLAWGQSEESLYALPALVGDEVASAATAPSSFRVGDRVRVFGRIECVSVSDTKQDLRVDGRVLELRDCIREIHVTLMEPLAPATDAQTCDLDWEANHWVKSIRMTKPADNHHQNNTMGLRSGIHALEWLGPKIKKDVEKRRYFPSAGDSLGAWRVFGVACSCRLPYQDALLYCHCQAKTEPLDPNLTFRDALLQCLLEMEERLYQQSQQLSNQNPSSNLQQSQQNYDLRFQYQTISNHRELREVALKVVAHTELHALYGSQLVLATVRALRHDGILSLLDEPSDTYLLVTRRGVLEPYLRRFHQSNKNKKQKQLRVPFYLESVPKARLQYVKRCYLEETDGNGE